MQSWDVIAAIELGKSVVRQRAGDLTGPVRTEVEEDHGVVVRDDTDGRSGSVDDTDRFDKLVPDVGSVRVPDGRHGIRRVCALPPDKQPPGLLDAIPPLVAVHGEIATNDRGDAADSDLLHHALEFQNESVRGLRRRVATIEEAVHDDARQLALPCEPQQGVEMLVPGVHAAVRNESHQVKGRAVALRVFHSRDEDRILEKVTRLDSVIDARDVHTDNSPGADVEVPDLAVAHLSVRKSDALPAGVDERVRVLGHPPIPVWRVGKLDGVGLRRVGVPPAIEDHEGDRCVRTFGHVVVDGRDARSGSITATATSVTVAVTTSISSSWASSERRLPTRCRY